MNDLHQSSVKKKGDNIQVVVRIRPENELEKSNVNSRIIVCATGENVVAFDPKEVDPLEYFHGKARKHRDINKRANKDLSFAFDRVFDEFTATSEVYDATTKNILDSLLGGYNCSVFAYGATGSGKTFSMLGSLDSPGVIFLTMVDLYKRIEDMKDEKVCEVKISYLEVYNEQIRDLLPPERGQSLPVLVPREDPRAGVVVKGLSLHTPKTVDELLHMLTFGNENRTQHPTDANAESSRSHAVFQVFVQMRPRTAGVSTDVQIAKMSLIDLAGSERATVTKNRGARFREGANINRSLLALGNVINALADAKVSSQHVPYRDSKLTRLLKDSLGGNCRTVMIAAVSPSSLTYEDTYNTLRYADRAKNIKTHLKKNVVNVDVHISKYTHVIDELRKEISELKSKLEVREKTPSAVAPAPLVNMESVCDLQDVLHRVFVSRISIQREILEFEACERDIEWRLLCKQTYLKRFSVFCGDVDLESNAEAGKIRHSIATSESRLANVKERKDCVKERLKDNCSWLTNVENEAKSIADDGVIPEILSENLRTHHLEVELSDSKRYIKHLKKLMRSYELERQHESTLITALLSTVCHQHEALSMHNWVTSDVEDRYNRISRMVLNSREVSWADQSEEGGAHVVKDMSIMSCVKTSPLSPARRRNRKRSGGLTPSAAPSTPKAARSTSLTQSSERSLDGEACIGKQTSEGAINLTAINADVVVADIDAGGGSDEIASTQITLDYAGHTPFTKRICATHHSPEPMPSLDLDIDPDGPPDTLDRPKGRGSSDVDSNNDVSKSLSGSRSISQTPGGKISLTNDAIVSTSPPGSLIHRRPPITTTNSPIVEHSAKNVMLTPSEKVLPHPLARINCGNTHSLTKCHVDKTHETEGSRLPTKPAAHPTEESTSVQTILSNPATSRPINANKKKLTRSNTVTQLSSLENCENNDPNLPQNRKNRPSAPRTLTKSRTTTCLDRGNSPQETSRSDKSSVGNENPSRTVTKSVSPLQNDPESGHAAKPQVVRVIKFDSNSPSFADIVKSPVRSPLQSMCLNTMDFPQMQKSSKPEFEPLKPRLRDSSVPASGTHGTQRNRKPSPQSGCQNGPMKTFPMSEGKVRRHIAVLKRAGLPSFVDESNSSRPAQQPNYMQMTKSTSRRQMNRSVSSRDVNHAENKMAPRRQFLSSVTHLPQPGRMFKSSKSSSSLVR